MSKQNHEPTDTEMLDWVAENVFAVKRELSGNTYLWYWGEKGEPKYVKVNDIIIDDKLAFRVAIKQAMTQ